MTGLFKQPPVIVVLFKIQIMNKINNLISSRWSPYSFADRTIDNVDIESLFKAASTAPSSYNEQPWLFSYAVKSDAEKFNRYLDVLVESNRIWASGAYMIVITLARNELSLNGKINKYAFHDTGMATATFIAQATSLGLAAHIMGGFNNSKARDLLNLQEGVEVVHVMAVGYRGTNPVCLRIF